MSKSIETLNLQNIIENLRAQMHLLAACYGISHPQVLEASQLLDTEISKYYRMYRCH